MHEIQGRVVRRESGRVWVEALADAGCATCAGGGGCGVFRWPARRPTVVVAAGDHAVGDEVIVCTADGAVLLGTLVQYMVPLAGLFAGALLVSALSGADSDLARGLGAVAGLAAGLGAARFAAAALVRRGWLTATVRASGRAGFDAFPT